MRWMPLVLASVFIVSLANGLPAQEDDGGAAVCPVPPPPASFTDIVHLPGPTAAAVSCIVYFGVTTGTTAASYSPESSVTRSQMARFLTRTAAAVGVEASDGADAPFDDLDALDEDGRLAVNRLWRLGITRGAGSGAFDPQAPVSRRQMALFLSRTLQAAEAPRAADAPTLSFTDLGGLPQETVDSLQYLAGLGVEWSAAAETGLFEPDREVTRSEMAVLLAASLEAGGARPLRLTIELSEESALTWGAVVAEVTVTKPNGDPYPGVLVDVFVSQGLRWDGGCIVDGDARVSGGDGGTSIDCRIDRADPLTYSRGKVQVGLAHAPVPETDWVYAWTGPLGQEYNEEVPDQAWTELVWHAGPNQVEIEPFKDEQRYGRLIEVKAHLLGSRVEGQRMILVVSRQGIPVYTRGGFTAFDGGIDFNYRGPRDPSSTVDNEELAETVMVFWDRNENGVHDGPAELSAEITVIWDD